MNQPNNRRRQDTIQRIQNAMLSLLEEKNFNRITVQDVCHRAEVNRSTFYRHFLDLYDLMERLEQQYKSGVVQHWRTADGQSSEEPVTEAALCRLLAFILEHRTFYRAYLHGYSGWDHQEEIEQLFEGYLKPLFLRYGVVSRNRMQYYYRFCVAGFQSVLQLWLEQEEPEPPEEIAQIIYAMLRTPTKEPM